MINLISILKVGYLTRKPYVKVKYQFKLLKILNFLLKHGIIKKFYIKEDNIFIWLRYIKNQPLIKNIQMISKKSYRNYISYKTIKMLNNKEGTNTLILSTPYGYFTLSEALNLKLGGELLYKVTY